VLLIAYVVGGAVAPAMFSTESIRSLVTYSVPTALVAIGEACILIVAELDLSLGAILALSGVVFARTLDAGAPLAIAIIVALLVSALCGLINGLCVTRLGVSSFIVTLGSSFSIYGLALAVSSGVIVSLTDFGPTEWLANYWFGFVTPELLIFLVLVGAVALIVGRARWGRALYAAGGDREAAIRWGLPVRRTVLKAFILSAALAGAAGIILTIGLATGDPTVGSDTLLSAIAGAVIGGVAVSGGKGRIGSAACGAVALMTLQIVLSERNVAASPEEFVTGLVVVLVGLGRFDIGGLLARHRRGEADPERRDHEMAFGTGYLGDQTK
jgi:ribose transport system permease protein